MNITLRYTTTYITDGTAYSSSDQTQLTLKCLKKFLNEIEVSSNETVLLNGRIVKHITFSRYKHNITIGADELKTSSKMSFLKEFLKSNYKYIVRDNKYYEVSTADNLDTSYVNDLEFLPEVSLNLIECGVL